MTPSIYISETWEILCQSSPVVFLHLSVNWRHSLITSLSRDVRLHTGNASNFGNFFSVKTRRFLSLGMWSSPFPSSELSLLQLKIMRCSNKGNCFMLGAKVSKLLQPPIANDWRAVRLWVSWSRNSRFSHLKILNIRRDSRRPIPVKALYFMVMHKFLKLMRFSNSLGRFSNPSHLKSDNLCRWNDLHIEFGSFFILSFQLRLRSLRCFRLLIEFGNVSKFEYDKSSILMHLNFDIQALRNDSPIDVSHTKQYSNTTLSFRFMFISWRKDDKLWLCHLIHKFNMHLN